MDNLLRAMLVPSIPRCLDPDRGSRVTHPSVRGLRALGEQAARLEPDVLLIASAHWVTTFHHYVGGPRRLAGVLPAGEAPDPGRTVRYDYPGDPALARALVEAGLAHQIRVVLTEEPTLPLDAETLIALRYLTPAGDVPIVPISLCHLADLAEMLRWGRAIGAAVRASRKRTILAVTGVLPQWPGPGAVDARMPELLASGSLAELEASLGELAREASLEGGGRHLALLAGALGSGYRTGLVRRGRPAGPGNVVIRLPSSARPGARR